MECPAAAATCSRLGPQWRRRETLARREQRRDEEPVADGERLLVAEVRDHDVAVHARPPPGGLAKGGVLGADRRRGTDHLAPAGRDRLAARGRASTAETDWRRIAAIYDQIVAIDGSPMAALARASRSAMPGARWPGSSRECLPAAVRRQPLWSRRRGGLPDRPAARGGGADASRAGAGPGANDARASAHGAPPVGAFSRTAISQTAPARMIAAASHSAVDRPGGESQPRRAAAASRAMAKNGMAVSAIR